MIRSFADAETGKIWNDVRSRKLPPDIQDKALVKLRMLNRAITIDDLRTRPAIVLRSSREHIATDTR